MALHGLNYYCCLVLEIFFLLLFVDIRTLNGRLCLWVFLVDDHVIRLVVASYFLDCVHGL